MGDIYALFKESFKDIPQELLEVEMEASIGYAKNNKAGVDTENKRNGHSPKTVKSQYGQFQVDVPRDRNGEFEPMILPKHQRDVSGIEEKIISLYGRGMTTRDIHDQLRALYGIELSAEMVSKITDKIPPSVREWQSRPLEPAYPFVFMDAIHYKAREDGRILNRAAYVVLGVTLDGTKDILSITIGANESSKFWLGMLNDLKNRGGQRRAVFLRGRPQRLPGSDPRGVPRFPSAKMRHPHAAELEALKENWGGKYPYAISNWEQNWEDVSPFFQFGDDIRGIMYTTNIIEGVNRQFRKATKTKSVFPSDASLEKMLYLTTQNVQSKWTRRYRNWDLVLSQLLALYGDRVSRHL